MTDAFTTVAFDEATGAQLWLASYPGPEPNSSANALAVSPDGTTVYVTGGSVNVAGNSDYTTIAYDAATGAQRWLSLYNGPGNGNDDAHAITTSADGTKVYVTGQIDTGGEHLDDGTVAYDAATGDQLWAASYDGPGGNGDDALSMLASPNGSLVFVSGNTTPRPPWPGMTTIAYDAVDGSLVWANTQQAGHGTVAGGIAMTPSGGLVFAVGQATRSDSTYDLDVVAYVAATGSVLWHGPFGAGQRAASGIAVSPDGSQVYVSGAYLGASPSVNSFLVRDYQAGTGHIQWTSLFHGPGSGGQTTAIGVSADGSSVDVTGWNSRASIDYGTVSFSATGTVLWASWYDGPDHKTDWPTGLVVDPANGDVIVTGYSGRPSAFDFATVAYQG